MVRIFPARPGRCSAVGQGGDDVRLMLSGSSATSPLRRLRRQPISSSQIFVRYFVTPVEGAAYQDGAHDFASKARWVRQRGLFSQVATPAPASVACCPSTMRRACWASLPVGLVRTVRVDAQMALRTPVISQWSGNGDKLVPPPSTRSVSSRQSVGHS